MVVAGITMVRNEIDVIEFCIEHHLAQGLDYIYICDNGSTDGTYEYLLEKSKNDNRIILTRDTGDFHQKEIINSLSKNAYEDGCEWIVPFDADELWFSPNTLKNDLKKIDASAVKIEMKNFVQNASVINPTNNTYLNTKYRLPDDAKPVDLDKVVAGTQSMIENPAFFKFIIKTSPTLEIAPGAHSYKGQEDNVYLGKQFSLFHIPLRSYRALEIKAEQGQRLIDAGYHPTHGWHLQRYAQLNKDGLLYDEWLRNSETDGVITRANGYQRSLLPDSSVANMYEQYISQKGKGKITAVIRTIGRQTLKASIESALREFDDVIVVADRIDLKLDTLPTGPTYLKNEKVIDLYGGMCINLAANECVTEYICLLDDDDEYVVGAGDYMRETIIANPDVDIWIPGLKYNDGLYVCMEDGLRAGNVAVPTYKAKVLREHPFKNNMGNDPGLTDFYHVQKIFFSGHKVDWYKKHLYNVRPNLSGRLGQGKK